MWSRVKMIRNKFRVKDIDKLFKDYRTYAVLFIDSLWQQMIFIENKVINEVFDHWSK